MSTKIPPNWPISTKDVTNKIYIFGPVLSGVGGKIVIQTLRSLDTEKCDNIVKFLQATEIFDDYEGCCVCERDHIPDQKLKFVTVKHIPS